MQPINTAPTQQSALSTDTLALNDIHVPEQISNFPIAYGWWILAILILLMMIVTLVKVQKNRKRQKIKKQALAQLKNNKNMSNNDLISLLKWAAMHYFSRAQLAKLYGDSLQQFLSQQLPEKHRNSFTQLSEQAFKTQYQAHVQNEIDPNFIQATQLWLSKALPPVQAVQAVQAVKLTKNNVNQLPQQSKGGNL